MTNIQAALGLAQLERLDEFIVKKRHIGRMYTTLLGGISNIQLPLEKTAYAENIFWVFGIVLNDDISFDAREAIKRLAENNIGNKKLILIRFC